MYNRLKLNKSKQLSAEQHLKSPKKQTENAGQSRQSDGKQSNQPRAKITWHFARDRLKSHSEFSDKMGRDSWTGRYESATCLELYFGLNEGSLMINWLLHQFDWLIKTEMSWVSQSAGRGRSYHRAYDLFRLATWLLCFGHRTHNMLQSRLHPPASVHSVKLVLHFVHCQWHSLHFLFAPSSGSLLFCPSELSAALTQLACPAAVHVCLSLYPYLCLCLSPSIVLAAASVWVWATQLQPVMLHIVSVDALLKINNCLLKIRKKWKGFWKL